MKKIIIKSGGGGEEVYEGDEADKFLEKMKSENGHEMWIEIDEDGNHKKIKKIIIEKEVTKEKSD